MAKDRCLWCESDKLEVGKLAGATFQPEKVRFFTLLTGEVELKARVCSECGYVDLYADTAKLKKIVKKP